MPCSARELPADRGLLVVVCLAGEDEVIVGDGRLPRIDRVAAGDLVEGVDRKRRGAVRGRQQIGVDAQRRARRDRAPILSTRCAQTICSVDRHAARLRRGSGHSIARRDRRPTRANSRRPTAKMPPVWRISSSFGVSGTGS